MYFVGYTCTEKLHLVQNGISGNMVASSNLCTCMRV